MKRGAGKALQRARSPTPPCPPAPPNILAPIVIRLSGHAQTNDRLAMREIARQLVLQSGEALQIPLDDDQEADGGPAGVQMASRPAQLFFLRNNTVVLSQLLLIYRKSWER